MTQATAYEVCRARPDGSWRRIAPLTEPAVPVGRSRCAAALVIGTFGSVPYFHLQLEARRRLYPSLPLLVHDDASSRIDALRDLCARYGAAFETNGLNPEGRLTKGSGDLSAFVGGLQFAAEQGAPLLVKLSRRCVPIRDFRRSLRRAVGPGEAPIIGAPDARLEAAQTQFVALRTAAWMSAAPRCALLQLIGRARAGGKPGLFVEGVLARIAAESQCGEAPLPWLNPWAFAAYPGRGRQGYYWHRNHSLADYAALAATWGLDYSEADFAIES
jgi:hypothetical protein